MPQETQNIVANIASGKLEKNPLWDQHCWKKCKYNEWHWRSQCVHPRQEEGGTGPTWFCLSNNIVCSFHADFCMFVCQSGCMPQASQGRKCSVSERVPFTLRHLCLHPNPSRKLSNGDRLNWFFLLQFLVFRKHSNHQHKGVFFNCSAQISVLKRKTLFN